MALLNVHTKRERKGRDGNVLLYPAADQDTQFQNKINVLLLAAR